MRQKLGRILLGLSVLTAAILYLPADIYAAGSVSVTADKTDVGVSDMITVYIKTSEPEDPSVAPEISVTYDSDKLEVTDCNVDYGGGGGGRRTFDDHRDRCTDHNEGIGCRQHINQCGSGHR
mgnify:CR=1 FL=1